jgi:nifR3 family TIM-barrel protein
LLERKPVRCDSRLPWLPGLRHLLSPMSGVTDRPFRDICRRFGADMGFCEFASAAGLMYGGEATWRLLDTEGEKGLVGIQIFGSDPAHMAAAARLLADRRHDVLDINFGCPAKKVVKKCGGSALLADVPLLEKIVREVVAASERPVTAKIRTGWDEASVNFEEVGLLLQELGMAWVTLHGRTRSQKFRGEADWDTIARLVETLDIPVIGNGDVIDGASYRRLVEATGCHAVMVGRGAIGNPWLFAGMRAAETGTPEPAVTFAAMCEVTVDHIRGEVALRGEPQGCYVVRKHIARLFRGFPGASALRRSLYATTDSEEMIVILRQAAVDIGPGPLFSVAADAEDADASRK